MTFSGKEQIDTLRVIVVKNAISLYLKTGMKANRAYTPTAMREFASKFTGKQYARSRNGLQAAMSDLQELLGAKASN